jgi:hypothetical protein
MNAGFSYKLESMEKDGGFQARGSTRFFWGMSVDWPFTTQYKICFHCSQLGNIHRILEKKICNGYSKSESDCNHDTEVRSL